MHKYTDDFQDDLIDDFLGIDYRNGLDIKGNNFCMDTIPYVFTFPVFTYKKIITNTPYYWTEIRDAYS